MERSAQGNAAPTTPAGLPVERAAGLPVNLVALFLPSVAGGGAERVFLSLAEGFLNLGMQVDLVVANLSGDLAGEIDARLRLFDLGERRVLSAIPALSSYLKLEQPPVMLSALTHANLASVWANRLAGSPTHLILTEHHHWGTNNRLKDRLLFPIARLTYGSNPLVAVSNGLARDLRSALGRHSRIIVIHNPVNLDRIAAGAQAVPQHDWLIHKEVPVILSVGRLHPDKDYATLLRAIALVIKKRPVRLVILGEGQQRAYLEQLTVQLGLSDFVSMPGFVENPYACLSAADVYAASSVSETFSLALVEALACGITIVATDCPSGPAEVLENGNFGSLVAVRDPAALAQAILHALEHPRTAEVLKQRAQQFALEPICEQYLDLIQNEIRPLVRGR